MKNIFANFKSAAIIGFLLLLPFMILELVNRRNLPESFPVALFGFLWGLSIIFIVILTPLVQLARTRTGFMAKPVPLFVGVSFLALIAIMLGGVVIDQIPCFMGVPNCD